MVEDVVFSPVCNFDFCQKPGGHRWWTYKWVLSSSAPSNMSVLMSSVLALRSNMSVFVLSSSAPSAMSVLMSSPCCFYIHGSAAELTTKVLVFPAVLLLFKVVWLSCFFFNF